MAPRKTGLESDVPLPVGTAFAICAACAALSGAALLGWSTDGDATRGPFVWWDVALAYLLGAVPAAVCFAASVRGRASRPLVLVAALGSLLIAGWIAATGANHGAPAVLCRPAEALSLAIGASLLVAAATRRPLRPAGRCVPAVNASMTALALALIWLVPGAYATTRLRQHVSRLEELLDEARVAESRRLAHQLLAFDPSVRLPGSPPRPDEEMPLERLVKTLDRHVEELEAHVSRPLAPDAVDEDRLVRAEQLAMLGREPEAADVLTSLIDVPHADPRACNLLGLILETCEDFPAALAAFEQAAALWEVQSPSADRTSGLAQAVRGIAYAERKLGHYPTADTAYQRLLAIAPTADTHFLLAQFYEDTQQSAAARVHARRAMALAPEEYSLPGRELIDSLAVRHFGCLPVYVQERHSSERER